MAALYLHVPFRAPPSSSEVSQFAAAVVQEMKHDAPTPFSDASFRTLYVGGGRPSRLPESALRTLVETIRENLGVTAIEEATLEVHPADVSPSFLTALQEIGFTRLSVDARSSTADEGRTLLSQARDIGFKHLSVDLFFGGAEQSLSTWKASLHRAVDRRLPHVTLHEREAEASSSEDERAGQFAFAMMFLRAKGYEQYELTHFARPGHRSRYQTHVYAHGNVLGLGPGAESFWWGDRSDPSAARWSNVTDIAAYVQRLRNDASPVAQREDLDQTGLAREYILLRLRTREGLDLDLLADRYGFSLRDRRAATLERLTEEGLIHDDPDRVRLTNRGRLLADGVTRRLIRDA